MELSSIVSAKEHCSITWASKVVPLKPVTEKQSVVPGLEVKSPTSKGIATEHL